MSNDIVQLTAGKKTRIGESLQSGASIIQKRGNAPIFSQPVATPTGVDNPRVLSAQLNLGRDMFANNLSPINFNSHKIKFKHL
jgi:hypothetical protein